MTRFLTVDRFDKLFSGMVLDLTRHDDILSPEIPNLQEHVDLLFPSGVSSHGDWQLLNGQPSAISDPVIELIFELVRRSTYPGRPSRLQAMFGWKSLADARKFRDDYGVPENRIWEIKADKTFVGDMRLLTFEGTALMMSARAHMYWEGESLHHDPIWEIVARLPAKVISRVD